MSTARPNFVFILADDWGWGDLGSYGHEFIKTPHLDGLAAQGTLYTQYYVCSGVCSPSRASLMTGQFPARHGIHGHFDTHEFNARRGMPNWLDPSAATYTRMLQRSGYAVGHYGKWHMGNGEGAPEPSAYGIDESLVNAGNGPQLPCHINFAKEPPPDYQPRSKSSEMIVDETIGFIDRHRERPFLVNVWLNDTHAFLDPDPQQLESYRNMMPPGLGHKYPGANAIYASVATDADRHIGRLLQHLEARGLAENTVVIFSADNGPEDIFIGNASYSGVGSSGPFRGRKRSLYEGGIRVPFILRWPAGGAPPGQVDDTTPLCAVDLLPTFCKLAGIDPPDDLSLDGEDMSDVFRGAQRPRRTDLFWEWRFRIFGHCLNRSPMLAMRRDQWMLLMNPDRSRVELFDVPADPMQLNNLASAHPDVVNAMAEAALAWQATLPPGPTDVTAGSNAYPWPKSRSETPQMAASSPSTH